jgi:hypothetical protein
VPPPIPTEPPPEVAVRAALSENLSPYAPEEHAAEESQPAPFVPKEETEFQAPEVSDGADSPALELPVHRQPVQRGLSGTILIVAVILPLISYSILATIAVIILYTRPQPPHPLEYLPDLEGDLKGAKRERPAPVSYERPQPDVDLPAHLHLALGVTLTLGQLDITPVKVERARISIAEPGALSQRAADESLVLHVRFKNNSGDVSFSPTDPHFERRWKGPSYGSKPYNFLQIGERRFYGGPLPWSSDNSLAMRDHIDGQEYRVLGPGESQTTLVCTDPTDPILDCLTDFEGEIVWRIQVRRGLVKVGDREVPATAVVGVKFSRRDIGKRAT